MMSRWSRASLLVLAVGLAAPRLLRHVDGAVAVGDTPIRVSTWLIVLAFLLSLPSMTQVLRGRAGETTASAAVPFVLAALGVLWLVAFSFLPPD